jgi:uncharacterized protein (DUF2249 family)
MESIEEITAMNSETNAAVTSQVVDVTSIAPRERHPLIFNTFDQLSSGQSFILVNDHDPKPLHYQFMFERKEAYTWEYLEEGPEQWRVRIGKK